MRTQFFRTLLEIAEKDKKVILLVGDLGFSFKEEFERVLPGQIINCGVIEQTMIGIAAGLALAGKKPYCYSATPFLLFRAYEQIRNDVCYNNLNVKIIGTLTNDFLGFTHNLEGTENEEDLLKNLPEIERYYPQTKAELEEIIKETYQFKKPAYVRLTK